MGVSHFSSRHLRKLWGQTWHTALFHQQNFFVFFIFQVSHRLEFKARLSIPYRTGWYGRNILYRPVIRYARPLCFVPEKIPAVLANFGQYRLVPGVPTGTKFFIFYLFFFQFCNFEFLLGQNGNLFVLTYYYYLFFSM